MRKKIRNILHEVQGDLFSDEFAKADKKREMIEDEISRLRSEVLRLEQEIDDWKNRPYYPTRKTVKVRGEEVSVAEINERNRKNEIANRKIKIEKLNKKIEKLQEKIKGKGESWKRIDKKR